MSGEQRRKALDYITRGEMQAALTRDMIPVQWIPGFAPKISQTPILLPDWMVFVAALLVVVAAHLLYKRHEGSLRRRKSREIAQKAAAVGERFRNAEWVDVDANAIKGLRFDELELLTDQFTRLGFLHCRDFGLRPGGETGTVGFSRAFVNPELKCFAEIMASHKTLDSAGPLTFGVSSFLEDGWSVASSHRTPRNADYLWRHPRALGIFLPHADPAESLRRHIEVRDEVIRNLDIKVIPDLSLEGYQGRVRERLEQRNQILLNADILSELPEAKRVSSLGEWVWWGDYPAEVAKKAKGKQLRPLLEISPTYRIPQQDAMEQMKSGAEGTEDREGNGGEQG